MHAVSIASWAGCTAKHLREASEAVHSHDRHASCLDGLRTAASGHNLIPGIRKPLNKKMASTLRAVSYAQHCS